jgi:hypothetical protein
LAADETGVPADMIDMQMRAQHSVDAVWRKTRRGQPVQERILAVVPGRHIAALLVVAKPGVDNDPPRRRFHQQRVDRHLQPAFFIGEVRDQPGQLLDFLVCGERQDETRVAQGLELDDLCDPDLADLPLHPRFLLFLVIARNRR